MSTRNLVLLLIPLVLLAGLLLYLKPVMSEPAAPIDTVPTRLEIIGIFTCLPHRDTTGPQTMECAFGLREDGTGDHYSIDARLMASMDWQEIPTGSRVRVSGLMTPVEMLSSDYWQKYDIVGIISATTIESL